MYQEPAGFWVRGASTAKAAVTTAPAARELKLRLHGGGSAVNHVRVETPSWSRDVELRANTMQDIAVPLVSGDKVLEIRISPESGFVPADVDQNSHDRRLLGCWVEVAK